MMGLIRTGNTFYGWISYFLDPDPPRLNNPQSDENNCPAVHKCDVDCHADMFWYFGRLGYTLPNNFVLISSDNLYIKSYPVFNLLGCL